MPPFSVDVHLSPKAAERLTKSNESVIVAASFFGFPTVGSRIFADDMGEIHLGEDEIEMKGQGTARFSHSVFEGRKLFLLKNHDLKLLINVVSGRRSSPDNILQCGIFEDSLSLAATKGVRIECSLIEENDPTVRPTNGV